MDYELLVENQIEDGRALLSGLVDDGFDVSVAFWVRTSESPGSPSTTAAKALYKRLLEPLLVLLPGKSDLYLSPDGTLNLVPFDALHDETDYLLGRYRFHYLTSGRDLLREHATLATQSALLLANPDFGKASAFSAPGPAKSLYQRLVGLTPLPGAESEAKELAPLLGVTPLLAGGASEAAVRAAHSPFILHIATHGLFLRDLDYSAPVLGDRGLRSASILAGGRSKNVSAPHGRAPARGNRRDESLCFGTGGGTPRGQRWQHGKGRPAYRRGGAQPGSGRHAASRSISLRDRPGSAECRPGRVWPAPRLSGRWSRDAGDQLVASERRCYRGAHDSVLPQVAGSAKSGQPTRRHGGSDEGATPPGKTAHARTLITGRRFWSSARMARCHRGQAARPRTDKLHTSATISWRSRFTSRTKEPVDATHVQMPSIISIGLSLGTYCPPRRGAFCSRYSARLRCTGQAVPGSPDTSAVSLCTAGLREVRGDAPEETGIARARPDSVSSFGAGTLGARTSLAVIARQKPTIARHWQSLKRFTARNIQRSRRT